MQPSSLMFFGLYQATKLALGLLISAIKI